MFTSKPLETQEVDYTASDKKGICQDFSEEAINYVLEKTNLNKGMILADLHSGTGLLAQHFLTEANTVYCVEPDKKKRQQAAEKFWKNRNFIEINGSANHTCLDNNSIDVIICGKGMRDWEERQPLREIKRVLKKNGWLILMENVLSEKNGCSESCISELLPICYPGGIWEKKEFFFTLQTDYSTYLEIFGTFPEREEPVKNQNEEGCITLSACTVLHIGQPFL